MNRLHYICKYTPTELLTALGADCENFNAMPQGFSRAETLAHPNLCGFGKALLEAVLAGEIRELVLVNCCDTIRSVCDLLEAEGGLDFLYLLDVLRSDGCCSRQRLAGQLKELARAYGDYRGTAFDGAAFRAAFQPQAPEAGPYLAVLGARMGEELFRMAAETMPLPLRNYSCVGNRSAGREPPPEDLDFDGLMDWYAGVLLGQLPCMRMADNTGRRQLLQDPNLRGLVYHTVKFCDFYGFEYAQLRQQDDWPILKLESDYTLQSSGQLRTRLEAFAEGLAPQERKERPMTAGKGYFAGIDSGSTSTDVVILNERQELVAGVILPTGAGAAAGAARALEEALAQAGLRREEIRALVTTGYGRDAISQGDRQITEITCHARGAHYLDPAVRTVVDIGGQDSKVIRLDEQGNVENFVMNDKCAAGTGRFLEMMARTLELDLARMSELGLTWEEDITISSMCTVFAESEVVSLIARNKATADIIHGLNKAVAARTAALVKRVGGREKYMMTGGVSKNRGLVHSLEETLGTTLVVSDRAQLCGALGAALFAMEL